MNANSVDALGLPRMLATNLRKAGIRTTERLTALNADEVLGLFGVAEASLRRIETALDMRGLVLSDHATMVVARSGRREKKERPLTSAAVNGWLASVALLREQIDEAEAEADLLRRVVTNHERQANG